MRLTVASTFIDNAFTGPRTLVIEHGLIAQILPAEPGAAILPGTLTPGLIDIHHNGAFGLDCATAAQADWPPYLAKLRACGVTAVLPTIITAPLPALHRAAAGIAATMARHPELLGLHLEGPFLAPAKRGAHQAEWLQTPTPQALAPLLANPPLAAILRVLTLAPELPGALQTIETLARRGIIVALGHTAATAEQMSQAAAAGATLVTHLFNAQSPLSHRAPGAPGAALTNPGLYPCLIADGIHVDPMVLALAFAACPRAIAVTDSLSLAGLPTGSTADFGGAPATLAPNNAAYRADGTLAGAAITLDQGLRRLIAAGIPAEAAIAACTSRPAAALNLTDRGHIAIGQRADLVLWTDNYTAAQTWTAGQTQARAPTPACGTEYARPDLANLHTRPSHAIIVEFLAQERRAQVALATQAAPLAALADAIAEKLRLGGRLFYAGAGTSGRLALLDAVECTPTFGIEPGLIIPLLAGGPNAFLAAAEGAEDNAQSAIDALTAHNLSKADALVGIAASGATPFTLAAIRHANSLGALTGAITNNPATPIAAAAAHPITINSGPEIIAGSTRLSAGTTQKIALNLLSSTIMIRLGKTHGPYMTNLRATNAKLRTRAIHITAAIANIPEDQARTALEQNHWNIEAALESLGKSSAF